MRTINISWDRTWMNIAEEIATRSKDTTRQVGAVIVKNKKLLSLGYNGAPKGFNDNEIPDSKDRNDLPIKRKTTYMLHAEVNAVLNYGGSLQDLEGASIYVTTSPCFECAKVLAQVGIKRVIYKTEYNKPELWEPSKVILSKCGVQLQKFEDILQEESSAN